MKWIILTALALASLALLPVAIVGARYWRLWRSRHERRAIRARLRGLAR